MTKNRNIMDLAKEKLSNVSANKGMRYLLLMLLILLYYFPIIQFYINSASFIVFAGESTAYRYFYVFRMISGEINPHLWLPQGFVTTSIQKLIFILEGLAISPQANLVLSLEVFGYLTFFAHGLIAVVLLFFVMRSNNGLTNIQKALIILGLFLPIYGTGYYGRYYSVLPDYLSLDIVLSASFIYYFYFFSMRNNQEISTRMIAGIAFLSGVSVSNKITIIFLAFSLVILLGSRFAKQPIFLLRVFLTSIAAFVFGMLLPWLISHYPNYGIYNIGEYLKVWLTFIRNAPQEGEFIENIKYMWRDHPQYVQFVCIYLSFILFLLTHIIRRHTIRSQQFLITVGLVILAILQLFVALKTRSANTTNFEAFTALTSFTMMLIGFVEVGEKWVSSVKWGFIMICFLLIVMNSNFDAVKTYNNSRIQDANLLVDIHEYALSFKRPIVVVVPDNSFLDGMGMEEIYLKGFSDFPTWNITAGRNLMDEFVPNLDYRSFYTDQTPAMLYPDNVVILWYDKGKSVNEERTHLTETYPELKKILMTNGTKCRQWRLKNHESRVRIINVCQVP